MPAMPTAPICVALDLETTGLDSERDAIIEVGAVKFRDDDVLDTFGTFVSPGRTIPPEITDLTGIRDEDVAGAPGVHTVLAELARFVGHKLNWRQAVGRDLVGNTADSFIDYVSAQLLSRNDVLHRRRGVGLLQLQ
mgnify:CR=1 FL=1